jgi:hypothetical protein
METFQNQEWYNRLESLRIGREMINCRMNDLEALDRDASALQAAIVADLVIVVK